MVGSREESRAQTLSPAAASLNTTYRRGSATVVCFSGFKKGFTGYEPSDKDYLSRLLRDEFGVTVRDDFSGACTHLICPPGARTMKTIRGVLQGLFICPKEWILKSFERKEANIHASGSSAHSAEYVQHPIIFLPAILHFQCVVMETLVEKH
jgi:hypothetical protein